MSKYMGLEKRGSGTVALFLDTDGHLFVLNERSLKVRMEHMKLRNANTSEEERAMAYLKEAKK